MYSHRICSGSETLQLFSVWYWNSWLVYECGVAVFTLLGTLELVLAQPSVLMEELQWAQEWQDALGAEWAGSEDTTAPP